MLPVALIVFREALEAALIVSIVVAASAGIAGRNRWVSIGVSGGILGAGLIALFAANIARALNGAGQDVLNAAILLLAVVMLGWHVVWMARHGREMARNATEVGREVSAGARPLYALALITITAVLREGSETVLFVYSLAASSSESVPAMLLGGLIGIAGGIAVGAALYAGLMTIPAGRLFAVTNWMVLFLAAGLAGQAAGFLLQADLLPPLGAQVCDTSYLLTETSIPGKALHTLIGYTARPAGMQLLFYSATLGIILLLARLLAPRFSRTNSRAPGAASALVWAGAIGLGSSLVAGGNARAEVHVRSPLVTHREFEFEMNGFVATKSSAEQFNNGQSYTYALGYGVLPWWKIELEAETGAEVVPGGEEGSGRLKFQAATFENTFQITPEGKYFFNVGFFFEYSQGTLKGSPNEIEFGPILQKELNNFLGMDTLHTLNVFIGRELGPHSSSGTSLFYAWQSKALVYPLVNPGFELFGEIGNITRAGQFKNQGHSIGPVITGAYVFAPYGKIKYEIGYQWGLSNATARGGVRWLFEYEIAF